MSSFKINYKNNAANILTLINMMFGAISIFATFNGHRELAIMLIVLAGLADRFDGSVARKYNITSELGKQLDSMADSISFGIAPAILVYYFQFHGQSGALKLVLILISAVYICCGGYRLARYNCFGTVDGNFYGIPITIAGVALVATMLLSRYLKFYFYAIFMLILGGLMVSKILIKKR